MASVRAGEAVDGDGAVSDGTPLRSARPGDTAITSTFAPPARPTTDHVADRAHAHESAAQVLAERGDWRRAYLHMKAALDLSRAETTPSTQVGDQLRHEVVRLRREHAEARELSRRDSLTATWNRRYLDERLATLRDGGHATVCVAMADVDHFKQVNDTHGHAIGDQVLRRLVVLMSEGLPRDGFCARYGGEEFALVFPGTTPDEAVRLCEAARARVDEHGWEDIAPDLRITVSVGVSCLSMGPDEGRAPSATDPTALDTVDALLYVAKRAGRNAVAHRGPRGAVRLAGPASARRGIDAAARELFPAH